MKFIGCFFSPLVFGFLFLAPLIGQICGFANIDISGVSNIVLGLLIGGLWGLMAQLRGSWIWVRP